jgi:hypothetical protein
MTMTTMNDALSISDLSYQKCWASGATGQLSGKPGISKEFSWVLVGQRWGKWGNIAQQSGGDF